MAASHKPFVIVNRIVNPVVHGVLRSPAQGCSVATSRC